MNLVAVMDLVSRYTRNANEDDASQRSLPMADASAKDKTLIRIRALEK
jgi:hypothetical protein